MCFYQFKESIWNNYCSVNTATKIVSIWFVVVAGKLFNQQKTKVRIRNSFVQITQYIYGVPQGSVIGPLLFISYVNNVNLFINCDLTNLFADNMLLVENNYQKMQQLISCIMLYVCRVFNCFVQKNKTQVYIIYNHYVNIVNKNNLNTLQIKTNSQFKLWIIVIMLIHGVNFKLATIAV